MQAIQCDGVDRRHVAGSLTDDYVQARQCDGVDQRHVAGSLADDYVQARQCDGVDRRHEDGSLADGHEAGSLEPYLSRSQREQCEIDTMGLVPAAIPIHSEQRECRRSFLRASHCQ